MEHKIGSYVKDVLCESFHDPETNRTRVRPLPDQGLPTNLVIECCRVERDKHKIGTKFRTINVKICRKPDGRIYLRAKNQFIQKI